MARQIYLENTEIATLNKVYTKNEINEKLSDKVTKAELASALEDLESGIDETKQDKLVSGTNIKTINNQSVLGAGNIEVASVEANPTVSGDEDPLLSIEINNTKYKVEGVTDYNDLHNIPIHPYNGKMIYRAITDGDVITTTSKIHIDVSKESELINFLHEQLGYQVGIGSMRSDLLSFRDTGDGVYRINLEIGYNMTSNIFYVALSGNNIYEVAVDSTSGTFLRLDENNDYVFTGYSDERAYVLYAVDNTFSIINGSIVFIYGATTPLVNDAYYYDDAHFEHIKTGDPLTTLYCTDETINCLTDLTYQEDTSSHFHIKLTGDCDLVSVNYESSDVAILSSLKVDYSRPRGDIFDTWFAFHGIAFNTNRVLDFSTLTLTQFEYDTSYNYLALFDYIPINTDDGATQQLFILERDGNYSLYIGPVENGANNTVVYSDGVWQISDYVFTNFVDTHNISGLFVEKPLYVWDTTTRNFAEDLLCFYNQDQGQYGYILTAILGLIDVYNPILKNGALVNISSGIGQIRVFDNEGWYCGEGSIDSTTKHLTRYSYLGQYKVVDFSAIAGQDIDMPVVVASGSVVDYKTDPVIFQAKASVKKSEIRDAQSKYIPQRLATKLDLNYNLLENTPILNTTTDQLGNLEPEKFYSIPASEIVHPTQNQDISTSANTLLVSKKQLTDLLPTLSYTQRNNSYYYMFVSDYLDGTLEPLFMAAKIYSENTHQYEYMITYELFALYSSEYKGQGDSTIRYGEDGWVCEVSGQPVSSDEVLNSVLPQLQKEVVTDWGRSLYFIGTDAASAFYWPYDEAQIFKTDIDCNINPVLTSDKLKTINGESVIGSGNITINYNQIKYVPIINQDSVIGNIPFIDGLILHNGDKIHFDTNRLISDIQSYLHGLYYGDSGTGSYIFAHGTSSLGMFNVLAYHGSGDYKIIVEILESGGGGSDQNITVFSDNDGAWSNLDSDGNFTLVLSADITITSQWSHINSEWDGSLVSVIGNTYTPEGVGGMFYNRSNNIYKYASVVSPAPYTTSSKVKSCDSVYFDITKGEILAEALSNINYTGTTWNYPSEILFTGTGTSGYWTYDTIKAINATSGNLGYLLLVYKDSSTPVIVYATQAGEINSISYIKGFQNLGQFGEIVLTSKDIQSNVSILSTTPAWNGVVAGSTPTGFIYDKVILESELNTGLATKLNAYNPSGTGDLTMSGSITGSSFVKTGGTSSEFLKADGTIDSNSYAKANGTSSQFIKGDGSLDNHTYLTSVPTNYDTGYSVIWNYDTASGSPYTCGVVYHNFQNVGNFIRYNGYLEVVDHALSNSSLNIFSIGNNMYQSPQNSSVHGFTWGNLDPEGVHEYYVVGTWYSSTDFTPGYVLASDNGKDIRLLFSTSRASIPTGAKIYIEATWVKPVN